MSEPLHPGQNVGSWTVKELLSWGPRGGLYRVNGPDGPALVKELLYPPELAAEEQRRRARWLRLAVQDWQQLDHPQAIRVVDCLEILERTYLVLPELEGSPMSIQQKLRKQAPDPRLAVIWADQLASLVQALMVRDHPLTGEILRLDRVMVDSQGKLTVFHAGWSELLWRGSERAEKITWQRLLQDYAKLVIQMATGDAEHGSDVKDLPAGLIWVVGRCLSDLPGRGYEDWAEVRKALRNLTVHGDERSLGKLPPILGFRLPVLAELPSTPVFLKALLAALGVLVLCGVYWLFFGPGPPPRRPGLALAIGKWVYIVSPDRSFHRAWKFERPIQVLAAGQDGDRLLVGLKDDSDLQVVNPDTGGIHKLHLTAPPQAVLTTGSSRDPAALLKNGRAVRVKLLEERLAGFSSLQVGPDCTDLEPIEPSRLATVSPQFGLALYDLQSGKRLAQWAHSGYFSLMVQSGQVVTASDEGQLVILSSLLKPIANRPLPLRSGRTWLYEGAASSSFWSLQTDSQGRSTAGFWTSQNLRLVEELSLPAAPQVAALDGQGCLCWVDEQNRLYRLTHHPLCLEDWCELPGKVQAMTYLAPPFFRVP